MADNHLLNLRVLAGEDPDKYALVSFEGREAISECFDYRLELLVPQDAEFPDISLWVGQLCEFDVSPHDRDPRVFAGRIYAARRVVSEDAPRIELRVGPAYQALAYG